MGARGAQFRSRNRDHKDFHLQEEKCAAAEEAAAKVKRLEPVLLQLLLGAFTCI